MGDRFGRYSKYIIQERALPDIRDGLKPVQRRILFAMHQDGNTHDKAFRKSAKSVGNIMGNFHPHGDSSIYEAMVRMSQDWKLRETLIEMHGNNGSMDGDSPAAMRYTEARLSKLADELLNDIDKETVELVWNFDDTEKEPTVLPAAFPNLLVNGSTGISAGYATEIPTHNLGEVIDGTVYLLDHPDASLEKLLQFIPGPDFPTGGILQGKKELQQAYETGRGKAILRSVTAIESIKGAKEQIVITEIPYEVNKAQLVKKMDEVRLNKKVEGIAEVRDESDRTGLRIVVELKKEANANGILNFLLKNTDLQINYNFNMVAIDEKAPKQVGLQKMLASYIKHRREVIKRRSQFDLEKYQKRQHIVAGLMKALSILDEVIAIIRNSNDKKNAKENLISEFQFTEAQAEAIVTMMLYRLTNTDITMLQQEDHQLQENISALQLILNDQSQLDSVLKKELKQLKKNYATPRLTKIEAEISEIKIETEVLIPSEKVMVVVSREGYIKRSSLRSYAASKLSELGLKEGDSLLFSQVANTRDHLLLFTTHGNVIYRPVFELPDLKWKDLGEHISQTINGLSLDEKIIASFVYETISDQSFVFFTKNGMIKQTLLSEFAPWRGYKSKSTMGMKLKGKDELINVLLTPTDLSDVFLISHRGFALRYSLSEVPVVGAKAAGVKSMNLKEEDQVINGQLVDHEGDTPIFLVTQRGSVKKFLAQILEPLTRAKRGVMILKELKGNPHRVVYFNRLDSNQVQQTFVLTSAKGTQVEVVAQELIFSDRLSNGSFVMDEKQVGPVINVEEIMTIQNLNEANSGDDSLKE
ncbi:DNA topoisomerase IV subunit A [Enterococcus timonensis]|uniref:DNA topoisomerase IV subunit A n=1 Tax=Enterococcus timonensis TaxID=1852364 RepID=UPI0008DAF1DF